MSELSGPGGDRGLGPEPEIEYLATYRGTFRPRRVDDLKPNLGAMVGTRTVFYAAWQIEGGPYDGEWAMLANAVDFFPLWWIPSGDLERLERTAWPYPS